MTNRDMLIATLKGELEDYGVEEANVFYHIACPYYENDKRAKCHVLKDFQMDRKMCTECKVLWLDQKVDE